MSNNEKSFNEVFAPIDAVRKRHEEYDNKTLLNLGRPPATKDRWNILIVDDDRSLLHRYQETAQQTEGLAEHATFTFFHWMDSSIKRKKGMSTQKEIDGSFDRLISEVKEGKFDALFIDNNLGPGVPNAPASSPGYHLAVELRKNIDSLKYVPITIITANLDDKDVRELAANTGDVRFMAKLEKGVARSNFIVRCILEREDLVSLTKDRVWADLNRKISYWAQTGIGYIDIAKRSANFLKQHLHIDDWYFSVLEGNKITALACQNHSNGSFIINLEDAPPFQKRLLKNEIGVDPWDIQNNLDNSDLGSLWKSFRGWHVAAARIGFPNSGKIGTFTIYSETDSSSFRQGDGPFLHQLALQITNQMDREQVIQSLKDQQTSLFKLVDSFNHATDTKAIALLLRDFLHNEINVQLEVDSKTAIRMIQRASSKLSRIGGAIGFLAKDAEEFQEIDLQDTETYIYAKVIDELRLINCPDVKNLNCGSFDQRVNSCLTVPLMIDESCYGAVNLESSALNAFSAEDEALAQSACSAASLSISRLRARKFMNSLVELLISATNKQEEESLLDKAVNLLFELFGFTDLMILRPSGSKKPWHVVAVYNGIAASDGLGEEKASHVSEPDRVQWHNHVINTWQGSLVQKFSADNRLTIKSTQSPNEIKADHEAGGVRDTATLSQTVIKIRGDASLPDYILVLQFEYKNSISKAQHPLLEVFGQLIGELLIMQDRLGTIENITQVGHLWSALLHSIKTPLAAIVDDAETLQEGKALDSEKMLHDILQSAYRLSNTIKESSEWIKSPKIEKVDAGKVWNFQREKLMKIRNFSDVEIEKSKENEFIYFDNKILGDQIFNLLMSNALKYAGAGATLSMRLKNSKIIVQDTGVGIPDDIKEYLFSPSKARSSTGTGIGLFIARNRAIACGGMLDHVETQKGAKFVISTPENKSG